MTVHKVVIIECNGCGASSPSLGTMIRDLIHLAVPAPSGVTDARHDATAKGWTHTSSGKDLCPNCGPARPTRGKILSKISLWGH